MKRNFTSLRSLTALILLITIPSAAASTDVSGPGSAPAVVTAPGTSNTWSLDGVVASRSVDLLSGEEDSAAPGAGNPFLKIHEVVTITVTLFGRDLFSYQKTICVEGSTGCPGGSLN